MSAICDLWVNVLHCFHRPGLEIFNSIFKYCLCLLVIVLQFYLAEKKNTSLQKIKNKTTTTTTNKNYSYNTNQEGYKLYKLWLSSSISFQVLLSRFLQGFIFQWILVLSSLSLADVVTAWPLEPTNSVNRRDTSRVWITQDANQFGPVCKVLLFSL